MTGLVDLTNAPRLAHKRALRGSEHPVTRNLVGPAVGVAPDPPVSTNRGKEEMMGLDFKGSEAHWSYGGFMRFRQRLAASVGIVDLLAMDGFDGKGSWESVPNDPIVPFLQHSDCDGELSAAECAKIGPRLREILVPWADDYDKQQGLLLCDGMDDCAASGDALVFC